MNIKAHLTIPRQEKLCGIPALICLNKYQFAKKYTVKTTEKKIRKDKVRDIIRIRMLTETLCMRKGSALEQFVVLGP